MSFASFFIVPHPLLRRVAVTKSQWVEWMKFIDTVIDEIRALDLSNSKKAEVMDLLFTTPSKKSSDEG